MAWFKSGYKQTDTKDRTVSFTQAGTRENIRSGEKHKTIFGKIAKYFSDLKPVAFTGSYNDLRDKPSNLAPAAHRHSKSDITDFPSSLPASDVHAWAKAASKPAYTAAEVGAVNKNGDNIYGQYRYYSHAVSNDHIKILARSGTDTIYGPFSYLNLTNGLREDTSFDFTNGGFNFKIYERTDVKDDISPWAYGKGTLGYGSRWDQIYAVNGTIQTSDRNEKENISYIGMESSHEDTNMTDEQLIQLILGLKPVVYKRKNGESGRPHHGFIAQDFEELLKDTGIKDHAAFIKSPITREFKTEKEVEKEDGTKETVKEVHQEEIPGEYTRGLRYEEFIPDMARFEQILYYMYQGQQKRIESLEEQLKEALNRIEILEGTRN